MGFSDHCILSPSFIVAGLGYNAVPKGRLGISRHLSCALLEDGEVSMFNRVLEYIVCGRLDNELGHGILVGAGYYSSLFTFELFVSFLRAWGRSSFADKAFYCVVPDRVV
jgi:hypothetical protein